ncbi:BolA family protein [Marinobacter fonticola]|uniref:BolA family protein n=1 Tax=Marinobacter fonticola TaxID=2603215 RepID=UPI0011E6CFF0|nr:BolA/IbaG family iron-sulfur metabolism protein [Marinobacter fonticola]
MQNSNAPIQSAIEKKLTDGFQAAHLEVANESHMHSVPANSETHFKVTLVSEDFAGKNRVKRHQAIYGALGRELQGGVHALALHLYTPEEWQARNEVSPASPQCLGGSKHDKA